jgi:hypothetical protein
MDSSSTNNVSVNGVLSSTPFCIVEYKLNEKHFWSKTLYLGDAILNPALFIINPWFLPPVSVSCCSVDVMEKPLEDCTWFSSRHSLVVPGDAHKCLPIFMAASPIISRSNQL